VSELCKDTQLILLPLPSSLFAEKVGGKKGSTKVPMEMDFPEVCPRLDLLPQRFAGAASQVQRTSWQYNTSLSTRNRGRTFLTYHINV
jgi:hypothetical protein